MSMSACGKPAMNTYLGLGEPLLAPGNDTLGTGYEQAPDAGCSGNMFTQESDMNISIPFVAECLYYRFIWE